MRALSYGRNPSQSPGSRDVCDLAKAPAAIDLNSVAGRALFQFQQPPALYHPGQMRHFHAVLDGDGGGLPQLW